MSRCMCSILVTLLVACGFALGQTFTDVNSPQYYGKTGIPKAYQTIDANFALIEGGTVDGNFDEVTVNNTLTAISTNDATTNVVITVNGQVDGETIADDTIDDDSIDFTDVTGADLTLTDCSAVTASGAVQGNTLALSATEYFDVINTTQLVFVANGGATTNVIDADITN